MIWGADVAVTSTDYNNIMNNLPSAIDWKNSRVTSNDVTVWDQENFLKRELNRKGAYWLYSVDSTSANPSFSYYC